MSGSLQRYIETWDLQCYEQIKEASTECSYISRSHQSSIWRCYPCCLPYIRTGNKHFGYGYALGRWKCCIQLSMRRSHRRSMLSSPNRRGSLHYVWRDQGDLPHGTLFSISPSLRGLLLFLIARIPVNIKPSGATGLRSYPHHFGHHFPLCLQYLCHQRYPWVSR